MYNFISDYSEDQLKEVKMENQNTTNSNKDTLARTIAIVSGIVAIITLLINIKQCQSFERTAHLNINPEIKTYIKGTWPNFEFVIYNDGPIKALNLTIKKLDLNVEKKKIQGIKSTKVVLSEGNNYEWDPKQEIWIYSDELNPKESVSKYISSVDKGSKWTKVIKLDVEYYRESDLDIIKKQIFYFSDEDSVYNLSQFRTKPYYSTVMAQYFEFMKNHESYDKFMHKFDDIVPEK